MWLVSKQIGASEVMNEWVTILNMTLTFLFLLGLLESDTQRIIMGNRDWAQYIAEDLGYYIDFVSVQHATRLMRCGAQTETNETGFIQL